MASMHWTIEDKKQDQSEKQETLEKECTENTTFHGLNRVFNSDKPVWLRFLWTLAVLACSATCIWQIVLRFDEFFENNVNTQVSVIYQSPLPFPAVTVCNFNRFRASEITAEDIRFLQYILYSGDLYDYDSYNDESWSWLGSSFDYNNYFANISESFNYTEFTLRTGFQLNNNTLLECTWRGRKCYPENFTHVFTSYGNCYTFNREYPELPSEQPGKGNGLQLLIDIEQHEYTESYSGNPEAGLKILVHDQSDPPLMDSLGLALPPGFHSFVGVRKNEYMNIDPPHGRCQPDKVLQHYHTYTLSGCFIECRLNFIIAECGCKPVRYPGDYRVCTPQESATCVLDALRDLQSGNNGTCGCTVPCHYEQFQTSVSYASYPSWSASVETWGEYGVDTAYQRENFVLVDVYYEELNYQLIRESEAMTVSSLISDIGGNLGLFLGASLLTVGEIIEYIIFKLRSVCRSEQNQRTSSKQRPSSRDGRPVSRRKNAVDQSADLMGPRFYLANGGNGSVIYGGNSRSGSSSVIYNNTPR